jgi:hypothetical protein
MLLELFTNEGIGTVIRKKDMKWDL